MFTRKSNQSSWLREYSEVFSTVEGNSTFYGLPKAETVQRWVDETRAGFTICLKFPRAISHEQELQCCEEELESFLELLTILRQGNRLGPSFLQLSPNFSPLKFVALEQFLQLLPPEFPYAVEVRHDEYFDQGIHEQRLDALLGELKIDRVLVDSRPLFAKPASTASERISQGRKPRVPVRKTVTASKPFVRLIGRDQVADLETWCQSWAKIVAQWISQGLHPYVFTHTPDDSFAIEFARLFHQAMQSQHSTLAPLPEWPGEIEAAKGEPQQRLF